MILELEERTEEMGRRFRFVKELGVNLNLVHLRSVKTKLRKCFKVERLGEEVRNQR